MKSKRYNLTIKNNLYWWKNKAFDRTAIIKYLKNGHNFLINGKAIKLNENQDDWETTGTPTPHNEALYGDIAPRVLMAGDPQRAHLFADYYLQNKKRVSHVRGICVWTGTYKGVPLTIMGHGMGIPSICIYAHELYNFYGVETIYRFGSCGVSKYAKLNLGDIVLAESGWSDVPTEEWLKVKEDRKNIFLPTKTSMDNILETSKQLNIPVQVKPVIAANYFYHDLTSKEQFDKTKAAVVEMETYGLFAIAKKYNKKAACLLTVSDNIDTHEAMNSKDRKTKFVDMFTLAIEAIIKE